MEHPELYGPDHPDGLARAKAEMDAADRKRIEADNAALLKARAQLAVASDYLHIALFDTNSRTIMRSMAIDKLSTAAATLGYDLVKRDD